jgi:predicted transcriptional regulator
MDENHDSDGEQVADNTQYPDRDFLEAIEAGHDTTADIAEYVGCTRRAADYRLRNLHEQGEVEGEKYGRSLIWSLPE